MPPDVWEDLPRNYTVRGHRVLLDSDLARIYEVPLRTLRRAVRRNAGRFPEDFCLRLTATEVEALAAQSAPVFRRRRRRHAPYAFTLSGAIMASGVLQSERAVAASIEMIRDLFRMSRELRAEGGCTDP